MRWLKRLEPAGFDLPRRAPIQFWMMGTFALLIGIAVVVVGLYVLLFLRDNVRTEAREALFEQAERVALQQERPTTPEDMVRIVRQISRFTGLRITVATLDSVLVDVKAGDAVRDSSNFGELEEVQQALTLGKGVAERFDEAGNMTLYAALRVPAPEANLFIRLGEDEPRLYVLLRRMQVALLGSMIFALVLALLGSWIAAQRIIQPLRKLTHSAQRISQGDLEEAIFIESRASEFQYLSVSLRRMAERFRDDIKKLQRLVQIQNEFLGDVSHEVRNPIFAISGYIEALSSSDLPQHMRLRYAQKGIANLDRLNTLFADLIEIARFEYREDLIHTSPFHLHELLHEIEETVRINAMDKALDLFVTYQPMMVIGDRNRMRQVLTNLIENAIAYTDEGTVRCIYKRVGDKVRIEVSDTGRGIGKAHQDRIFDRFYRIDPARSRKSGGSGLGLSIVKQILHAHGEAIHLESEEGKGTTFWFELPYAENTPQEKHKETI